MTRGITVLTPKGAKMITEGAGIGAPWVLTPYGRKTIQRWLAAHMSYARIGKQMGLSPATVGVVCRRELPAEVRASGRVSEVQADHSENRESSALAAASSDWCSRLETMNERALVALRASGHLFNGTPCDAKGRASR